MKGKFINEHRVEIPKYVILDGRIYTNPEQHKDKPLERLPEYKEIISEETPDYNVETQYIEKYAVETEEKIIWKYRIHNIQSPI